MVNEQHLAVLRQGIPVWNNWRENNPDIRPNLSEADFTSVDLREADLSGVDLRQAVFYRANLSGTVFYRADLREANLSRANLTRAYLPLANLTDANLSGANLTMANFLEANLRRANLSDADLSLADFSEADLSEAGLARTQVWNVNFNRVIFTGACLEDWQLNIATSFQDITCDYVYLQAHQQARRPLSGNFAPGECAKLFETALETIELAFRNGIDWKAFFISFQKLKIENDRPELSIQGIENKSDGTLFVKINLSPEANQTEIKNYLKQEYEAALKAIDAQPKNALAAQEDQLMIYRQHSADLTEVVKWLANRT